MNALTRTVTFTAATLAALAFAPRSEAGVRVAVRVPIARRLVVRPTVVVVRPSPRHVFIDGAWVLPPYSGAVWVTGYRGHRGVWIPGHWR